MASAYERYTARKEQMLKTGKLTKSGIKELERPLNLAIEEKWEAIKVLLRTEGTDSPAAGDLYYSQTPTIKTLAKKAKAIQKFYKKYPEEHALIERVEGMAKEIIEQFRPDAEEMENLYKEAEQLKAKKEQEREARQKAETNPVEHAPAPSRATVRMVNDAIIAHAAELQAGIKADIEARMERAVEHFRNVTEEKGPITSLSKGFTKGSPVAEYLKTLVMKEGISPSTRDPLVLRDDYKARIKARAQTESKDIVEHFRMKTVKKLATVSEGFGTLQEISMRVQNRRGVVEGSIGVRFENGTEFDVRSQLVMAVAPSGYLFSRYPTTFHNVKQPGQETIKMMSETQMAKLGKTSEVPGLAV